MAFSALPVCLDPPNWQQQLNDQQGTVSENPQLPVPPPPPQGGASGGSIRPSSTSDRARLAKIPPPEAALKCPRCGSTNTKFCYFNNYSLSQPRHFCKACQRYWTKGGNIRNVPVGGGRRNKKNKTNNSSKSSTSSEKQVTVTQSDQITAHFPQQSSHLPFMSSLQNFSLYGLGNINGLNFGGIHSQIGETSGGASEEAEMRFQQQLYFFEQSNGNLYPFQSEVIDASSSSRVSQLAPLIKSENNQRLNLSRPVQLGVSENNQYWGGNSWTDLSSLNSSTTNHFL